MLKQVQDENKLKIAIIGYGTEGRSLHTYMAAKGHDITICDVKERNGKPLSGDSTLSLGPAYLKNLEKFDVIFRSPGVPYLKKEFDPVRQKVSSLTKYFFDHCPCEIVAVTGTKGKGTTSTLLYEMVKVAGRRRVWLGGNIGLPPLDFLDELKKEDLVVLELSSFQLQDLKKSPHVAIVLGITPDHLDHHRDLEEYVDAKKNIVRFQSAGDFAIMDADNEASAAFKKNTKAQVYEISSSGKPVTRGAFLKVGSLVIKEGRTGIIFGEKGQANLIGSHNLTNIMAAALAAHVLQVPLEIISQVAREFRGLPHRLELVRENMGVKFYNDSASTNPQTAIAALRSIDGPTILVAGGSDKNIDFAPLGEEIARRLNVKSVVLMGQTKQKIEEAIEQAVQRKEARIPGSRRRDIPLELISADTYQEAFMVCRLIAVPGDTVLFSPGCASFDMFTDYKERGEIFRNFVTEM